MKGKQNHHIDNTRAGFASSLMREIASLLEGLVQEGTTGAIDLRSMPMSDADRGALEELLGQGEIRATLDIAGTSEIRETAYAGVWWICHRGADERIASESIEVTLMPEILKTQIEDLPGSYQRLLEGIEGRYLDEKQEKSA